MSALPAPFCFRPHWPQDRDACVAVFRSNVPTYFAAGEQASFVGYLTDPTSQLWVIDDGHTVVGLGGVYRQGDEGRLCWGMVAAAQQRHGLGAALLRLRLSTLFADLAVTHVALATSQLSAGFFRRFGFVERGRAADGFAPGLDRVELALTRDHWARRHP